MSSSEREQLKPCPFCEKSVAVLTTASEMWPEHEDEGNAESYAVMCDAHRPDGPGGCGASGGFFLTEAEAIAAWNRRAQASAEPVAYQVRRIDPEEGPGIWHQAHRLDIPAYRRHPERYELRPLYAAPQRASLTEEQRAVLDFLYGIGDMQGVGFGDKPAGERGNYWWRKQLSEAFGITDTKAAIAAGTNGEAP